MRAGRRVVLVVLSAVAAAGLGCAGDGAARTRVAAEEPASPPAEAVATRDFELVVRSTVPAPPEGTRELDVWLPIPRSGDAQQVELGDVLAPVEPQLADDPEFGNRILHLRLAAPAAPVEVGFTARVRRREVRNPVGSAGRGSTAGRATDPALARWLEPDALVPLDERIRALSARVTDGASTDAARARAIYDYVLANMTYDKHGTGWGHGDIYWACDAKRGNCTDFHALFTGLARAAGIPAKFAIGFPLPPERGAGEIGGYHCWSAFWLPERGWVPIDASEASKHPERREYYFGSYDENRVELSEGRDLVLVPPQRDRPLNYFVFPYAEADGRPVTGIENHVRFKDVGGSPTAG